MTHDFWFDQDLQDLAARFTKNQLNFSISLSRWTNVKIVDGE